MVEGGCDRTPGAEVGDAAASGTGVDDRIFEPLQGGPDGVVVGSQDFVLDRTRTQCPEDRHGFRDAEGKVEADDGMARFGPALCRLDDRGFAVWPAQGSCCVRVEGVLKDCFRVGFRDGFFDGAVNAKQPRTDPASRWRPGFQVIVGGINRGERQIIHHGGLEQIPEPGLGREPGDRHRHALRLASRVGLAPVVKGRRPTFASSIGHTGQHKCCEAWDGLKPSSDALQ